MAKAKQKDKLNLDALLRVHKVTLENFVKSQEGETIENKVELVKSQFNILPEHEEALACLTKEENIAIKQAEDSKKIRKKKAVEEPEMQPEEISSQVEEKNTETT